MAIDGAVSEIRVSTEDRLSTAGHDQTRFRMAVILPVFNDWAAADLLMQELDEVCLDLRLQPTAVIVNDGSTEGAGSGFCGEWKPRAFRRIEVVNLYCNLGHQRALCVGVFHAIQRDPDSAILVMDSDGEDSPQAIPTLVRNYFQEGCRKAIFAERGRRTEGAIFKTFYRFYRLIHFLLIGFDVRIGNFSIIPPALAAALLRCSDFWNHYAAAVVKLRLPMSTIRINRAKRLAGKSKMSFTRLIIHGLSAMAVYSDKVGARVLCFATGLLFVSAFLFSVVVGIRLTTSLAIPGWATTAAGFLLLFVLQVVTIALLFSFGVLATRGIQVFIPIRDCANFICSVRDMGE